MKTDRPARRTASAQRLLMASAAACGLLTAVPLLPGNADWSTAQAKTRHVSQARGVELLFADGTSVTLAPFTQLVVQDYAFDGANRRMTLVLRSGAIRVAAGARGGRAPIAVTTTDGTISVAQATAIIDSEDGTATLVVGNHLTADGTAGRRRISRPGFSTTLRQGRRPTRPTRVDGATLAAQMAAFRSGGAPRFVEIASNGTVIDTTPTTRASGVRPRMAAARTR